MNNQDDKKEKVSAHYSTLGIEPFEIIEKDFTLEEQRGYYKGNILKYTLRDKKQNQEDAVKIQVYAEKLQDLELKIKVDETQKQPDENDEVCLLEDLVDFLEASIKQKQAIIEITDDTAVKEYYQYLNTGIRIALYKIEELKEEYAELDDYRKRFYDMRKDR